MSGFSNDPDKPNEITFTEDGEAICNCYVNTVLNSLKINLYFFGVSFLECYFYLVENGTMKPIHNKKWMIVVLLKKLLYIILKEEGGNMTAIIDK